MHRPKLHVGILAPVVAVFWLTALGQDTVSHDEPDQFRKGWAENYADALAAYNAGHYDKARQALESALEYGDLPANKSQRPERSSASF